MRQILAVLMFIVGIVAACYLGGWVMFIKPIIDCCRAFDGGTLTGLMVGVAVLKCVFAGAVASIIFWVGFLVAAVVNN